MSYLEYLLDGIQYSLQNLGFFCLFFNVLIIHIMLNVLAALFFGFSVLDFVCQVVEYKMNVVGILLGLFWVHISLPGSGR